METIKKEWKEKGYVDEPIPEGLDLKRPSDNCARRRMPSSWRTTIP